MTTFQSIVFAIVHGFASILPVGAEAHEAILSWALQWPHPSGALFAALNLGVLLALLMFFRHDWASLISSMLQVVLFRRKPMTLDERVPFFLLISAMPVWIGGSYLRGPMREFFNHPLWIAGSLAFFGLVLGLTDYFSRKTKNMADWNWFDSLVVGVAQILSLVPGMERSTAATSAGLFRSYGRSAAVKFMLLASLPLLLSRTLTDITQVHFHGTGPSHDLTWLSFAVALAVSFLVGLLAIGGLMKHVQKKGLGEYVIYRWIIAGGIAALYGYRMMK